MDGVDLKCTNTKCPNVELSNLEQWCTAIGETDGLQWTLMKQYLDFYNIKSIADLYAKEQLVLNDLTTRKISITETKILEFFKKLYIESVPAVKALTALNIPRLGDKTAQLLASEKDLILTYLFARLTLRADTYVNINSYKEQFFNLVKEATTDSILENTDKYLNLCFLFTDEGHFTYDTCRIVFNEKLQNQDKKYIAVTGSLNKMKRKDFEQYITQFGYEATSNLKKCMYLVNNDIESTSTKNKQAKELGVTIITEDDFFKLLNN